MLVVVMVLFVASCSSEPASGPITIETEIDSSTQPIVSTFEVTEGADVLGCSNGTFPIPTSEPAHGDTSDEATEVTKLMTCSDGDTGTFTILFDPHGYDTGPGDQNGPWSIVDATSDFAGLQGEGDFWVVGQDGTFIVTETFTGDIEYTR
jgi:hypothetical protein